MIKTYTGKVCHKHTYLEGLRMEKNRQCRQCYLDSKRKWASNGRNRDPVMSMIYSRLRQQKISQAMPVWADVQRIKEIYDSRLPGEHVDHIIPLKGIDPETGQHVVCGLHVHNNLQVLPADDNGAKWAYWKEASK